MPGPGLPWLDTTAPSQWVGAGSTGASGPLRGIFANTGNTQMNATSQTYDTQRPWKLAGTIVFALVVIFVLQAMGFRFVGAASVGFGAR